MRSVVVVLPASMCAAMPMLRVRSIEYCRLGELCVLPLAALSFSITASIETSCLRIKTPRSFGLRGAPHYIPLPAEMRKCFIGLGHLMDLIAFADGIALPQAGLQYFSRQGLFHGNTLPGVGKINQPAQRQRELAVGGDFQRNLVSGAADPAGLDFKSWLGVIDRSLQNFQRIRGRVLGDDLVEGTINNPLRHAFIAGLHDGVDEAGKQRAVEFCVLADRAMGCLTASRHLFRLKV